MKISHASNKVGVLHALSDRYYYLDFTKAILYAQQAIDLSRQLGLKEDEIRSLYKLGTISFKKDNGDNSLKYLEEGLKKAKLINNGTLEAKGYYHMGKYYEIIGGYASSLDYLNRSLVINTTLNKELEVALCFTAIGSVYYLLSNYEKSLVYYFKAMRIHESLENKNGLSSVFTNIGNTYLLISKFDEAKFYFLKALAIDLLNGDRVDLMNSYLNLGVANQKKGEFNNALAYFNDALVIARGLNFRFDEAILLGNMGSTFRAQGNYEKSRDYLLDALAIKKELKKWRSVAHTINDLSETFLAMDDPQQAKKYALEAIVVSEGTNLHQQGEGYDLLAKSMYRLGELDAYRQLLKANSIKDSIFSLEAKTRMDELEVQYETTKKEDKIHLLTEQNNAVEFKKRSYLAAGIMTSVVLLLLFNQQRLKTGKNRDLLEKEMEVDRMKSQFFANISHEFRTPLTLILGPIETIRSATDDQKTKYSLEVMKKNANKLLALINQLLDLSKLEAGKYNLKVIEEDLIPIVKGVTMAFHSLAELKDIDLKIHADTDHLNVFVDREKLEIILVNLLSNAFKFTPRGGEVKVSISVKKLKGIPKSYVLTISDTGKGIPKEDLSQIFNRFYQSKHDQDDGFKGTGIGLALTKELVERHKGTIAATSRLEIDTHIIIELPIGKEHFSPEELSSKSPAIKNDNDGLKNAEIAIDLPSSDPRKDQSRPILLLVEDNIDVMYYLKDIFKEEYNILQAFDGEQGIEVALEHIPDVIICDVMMPKKNGYAVCKTLKQDAKTSHIPIILLTAKASMEDKMEGLETSADDYMTKPFFPKELKLKVSNLIVSRKQLREKFKHDTVLKPSDIAVNSVDEAFLQKIKELVEENMGDEFFGVEPLAFAIGMSRSQLHRKFKALLNLAPNQFIRSFRLQRAHDLLKQQAATSTEIAYQVGFGSPSYFTKCFHEQYGFPPSEMPD